MRRLESSIEQANMEWAHKEFGLVNTKVYNNPGFPDRILWVPGGRPTMLEYKRPGSGRFSPLQIRMLTQLTNLGYTVEAIDDAEYGRHIIQLAVDRAKKLEGL